MAGNKQQVKESITDLLRSDGSIIVNKKLIHSLGLNAAIMYSELVSKNEYFKERDQLTEDGFFFNTIDNMRLDTGLGEKPQAIAIKLLVNLKLIQVDKRGLPAKRYFKLNEDTSQLKFILQVGGGNKDILKSDLVEKNKQKKESHASHINSSSHVAKLSSSQKEKLVQPNGRINNTKSNNTKNNNNIYIISENDGFLFSYYSSKFKDKFGEDHPTMNKEKNEYLVYQKEYFDGYLEDALPDLNIDYVWEDLVDYHFSKLPKSNNGNILAFLEPNGGYGMISRYIEELYG
jgi:hypothetical protein